MEGIEFEQNNSPRYVDVASKEKVSWMVGLVMKMGAPNPKKANKILLISSVVIFLISMYLFFK